MTVRRRQNTEEKLRRSLRVVSEAEALNKREEEAAEPASRELRHLVVWLVWFPLLALDVCRQTSHVYSAPVVVNSMNLDVTETFTTVKQLEVRGDDFYRERRVKLTKTFRPLFTS